MVDFEGRTEMRTTFDRVADDYDRVRPKYPEAVFDDAISLSCLRPGARVLEIGCGTGQATAPFAERGLDVLAVELGKRLAALARTRLARLPNVEVVCSGFEDWEPRDVLGFDAVVSFAAFHWVDPDLRYAKASRLLNADGALVVFDWQDALSADGDSFFVRVLEDYAAVVPEWEVERPRPPSANPWVDRIKAHADESGYFAPAEVRHYVWSVTYAAADYIAFLGTTGSFGTLDERRRNRLLGRIEQRIIDHHEGSVQKEFLGTLAVSRKRS